MVVGRRMSFVSGRRTIWTIGWTPPVESPTARTRASRTEFVAIVGPPARQVGTDITFLNSFNALGDAILDVKFLIFESAALLGKAALLFGDPFFKILKPVFQSLLKQLDLAPDNLLYFLFDGGLFCGIVLGLAILIAQLVQPLLILEFLNDRVRQFRASLSQLEVLDRNRRHMANQHVEPSGVSRLQIGQALVSLGKLFAYQFHDLVNNFRRNRAIHRPSTIALPAIAPPRTGAALAKSPPWTVAGPIHPLTRPVGRRIFRLRHADSALGRRKKKGK